MLPHKVLGVNCFCFTLPIGWEGGRWDRKNWTPKSVQKTPMCQIWWAVYADPTRILRGFYADWIAAQAFWIYGWQRPKPISSPNNPMRQKLSHFSQDITCNFKAPCASRSNVTTKDYAAKIHHATTKHQVYPRNRVTTKQSPQQIKCIVWTMSLHRTIILQDIMSLQNIMLIQRMISLLNIMSLPHIV